MQAGGTLSVNAAAGVLANDTDPIPNDVLAVSAVNGSAANVGLPVKGLYGSLTLNSDGGYTYHANGSGLPGDGVGFDTFSYTAQNGLGDTVVVVSATEHYIGGVANTTISGGNFKFSSQVLDGSLGNDVLIAGKNAAVEIGGPNDTLTGSNAADNFVFHGAFGQNEITNFGKNDSIWFDHSDITSFKQVVADATQVGANVVINDGAGDILQLDHVQLSALIPPTSTSLCVDRSLTDQRGCTALVEQLKQLWVEASDHRRIDHSEWRYG